MKKLRFIAGGLLALLGLWLGGFVLFACIALTMPQKLVERTTDAIVVLTGGANRIDRGLELFANGKATHLFISGVHPDVKNTDILGRWHGDTALPLCCLSLGKRATTTIENAIEIKDWAAESDIHSIRLVTSNYHMPRAVLEIKKATDGLTIIEHPIQQDDLKITQRRLWALLFEEYHKYLLRSVQLLF